MGVCIYAFVYENLDTLVNSPLLNILFLNSNVFCHHHNFQGTACVGRCETELRFDLSHPKLYFGESREPVSTLTYQQKMGNYKCSRAAIISFTPSKIKSYDAHLLEK